MTMQDFFHVVRLMTMTCGLVPLTFELGSKRAGRLLSGGRLPAPVYDKDATQRGKVQIVALREGGSIQRSVREIWRP